MSDYCKAGVYSPGMFRPSRCSRKARRDGYCAQHHPDAQRARDAKRKVKWDRERRQREAHFAVKNAERAVVEAAERWMNDWSNGLAYRDEKHLGDAVEVLWNARAECARCTDTVPAAVDDKPA